VGREPVHKENAERKVSDLHDNVHIVKRNEHKFVKSSSHKLDFVKRSLHKLETINCTYTNAYCLTNKVSKLRLLTYYSTIAFVSSLSYGVMP
jgi:hypothetical protein